MLFSVCDCYTAQLCLPALICIVGLYIYRVVFTVDDCKLDRRLKTLLEGKQPDAIVEGDTVKKPRP